MSETPRWREDFPIEWGRDDYVTRRELTKFLVLGSGLLAGANAALAITGILREPPKSPRTKVATASAVGPGGSLLFRYPTEEDPCILVRGRDGRLEAYSQVCTHLSCAVVHRPGDDTLYCPCHCGVFTCGEGRPIAGPPTRRLPRILLEVQGEDVYATGIEL